MHGASRTGKTWSATKFFKWEKPGDTTSRELDFLKISVNGVASGFFNSYLGQELIIVDEVPAHWANDKTKVRAFLEIMDNYECTMNTKNGFVPKRAWRFVFCSNYCPAKVFSTSDRGVGQFV